MRLNPHYRDSEYERERSAREIDKGEGENKGVSVNE